jgi:hypothetical protein
MTQMWYSKAILQKRFSRQSLPDNAMTEQEKSPSPAYQQLDGLMLRATKRALPAVCTA